MKAVCVRCLREFETEALFHGPARCERCAKVHAKKQEALRKRRKRNGFCPQCGKAKLADREKSCLNCMLKVKDGDDFVNPISKSTGWAKRLKN